MADNALQSVQKLLQDLIAPDVRETKVRLEQIEKRMDAQFESMRKENSAQFASVNAQFASVDAQFASVDTRFASVDAQFESMRRETPCSSHALMRSSSRCGARTKPTTAAFLRPSVKSRRMRSR